MIFCELWFLDSLVVKNGLAHAWLENFSQNYCHNNFWNYLITFDAWRSNILLLWINRSAIFPIEFWIHYCWHKVWQDLFGDQCNVPEIIHYYKKVQISMRLREGRENTDLVPPCGKQINFIMTHNHQPISPYTDTVPSSTNRHHFIIHHLAQLIFLFLRLIWWVHTVYLV